MLSDIVMPEMDGIRLLSELRAQDPDVPVIMVTAMHDISIALEAIRAGAYDYISKTFRERSASPERSGPGARAPAARDPRTTARIKAISNI